MVNHSKAPIASRKGETSSSELVAQMPALLWTGDGSGSLSSDSALDFLFSQVLGHLNDRLEFRTAKLQKWGWLELLRFEYTGQYSEQQIMGLESTTIPTETLKTQIKSTK